MKKVYVYFHTHWDREWYKTRVEFNFRLVKVVDDILDKLSSNELPCFYFDGQTSALIDYLKFRPEKETQIRQFIKDKKLFIGPFFDLADEFLVGGESLLRNLQIGRNEALLFNADENDFIGYLPDAFGHTKIMPMLFNKANIKIKSIIVVIQFNVALSTFPNI